MQTNKSKSKTKQNKTKNRCTNFKIISVVDVFNPLRLHFRFPNVIILTTSNVTGAIDLAFVDRYSTVC